jgi:hypothetical protein
VNGVSSMGTSCSAKCAVSASSAPSVMSSSRITGLSSLKEYLASQKSPYRPGRSIASKAIGDRSGFTSLHVGPDDPDDLAAAGGTDAAKKLELLRDVLQTSFAPPYVTTESTVRNHDAQPVVPIKSTQLNTFPSLTRTNRNHHRTAPHRSAESSTSRAGLHVIPGLTVQQQLQKPRVASAAAVAISTNNCVNYPLSGAGTSSLQTYLAARLLNSQPQQPPSAYVPFPSAFTSINCTYPYNCP